MIIGISVTLAEGCLRSLFTPILFSLIRFFTSNPRGSLSALRDHGGEDPLIAMFRKLRFTWSIAGGGKNAKGMLKGMGGKENGMVLEARV